MGYEMIENVGNLLVELLCRELVPDLVPYDSNIGLCSPDNHGNFTLGIYLYDISENEDVRASGMVNAGVKKQRYPSIYLSLYYMITVYSDSDIQYRAQEEHKILGKVIQTFRDNSTLSQAVMGEGVAMPAQIQLQRMERFEKIRMWNFANEPYKLSLFYQVQPVEISSVRTREIARVKETGFTMLEEGERTERKGFHASLVVLVIDSFTGKPVVDGNVVVSIPGQRTPVVKSDGYHVFVNLTETKISLVLESKVYECRMEQVDLTDREEDEVLVMRIMPGARYSFPADTICVSGQTWPGRKLLFWSSGGETVRLLEDYRCQGQDGSVIAIYHPDEKELVGKTFFISGREKEEKEYFRIIGGSGRVCQMDKPLSRDYHKIGTMLVPVQEIHADETGNFFFPIPGDGKRQMEINCLAEGDSVEKKFLLAPGRVHKITL